MVIISPIYQTRPRKYPEIGQLYLTYRRLISEIIAEYPNHEICYTDGSKFKSKTAYAFSIHGSINGKRLRHSASVFTAELNAIHSCLSQLTQRPPQHNYILLTDSLPSLLTIQDIHSTNPIT